MREPENAFHLAIPARDLDEAQEFYVHQLGCHLARRYDDRITLNFFGDQVVCHLSDSWDQEPLDLYPRHFGSTFRHRDDFESLQRLIDARHIPYYRPCQSRFEGLAEEHMTMVLRDPSNNFIEFKWYRDPRMIH